MKISAVEKAIRKALRDEEHCFKVLWRMSQGNLDRAREIVKSLVPHYTASHEALNATEQDFNMSFDIVCGELNDGIEVEWAS